MFWIDFKSVNQIVQDEPIVTMNYKLWYESNCYPPNPKRTQWVVHLHNRIPCLCNISLLHLHWDSSWTSVSGCRCQLCCCLRTVRGPPVSSRHALRFSWSHQRALRMPMSIRQTGRLCRCVPPSLDANQTHNSNFWPTKLTLRLVGCRPLVSEFLRQQLHKVQIVGAAADRAEAFLKDPDTSEPRNHHVHAHRALHPPEGTMTLFLNKRLYLCFKLFQFQTKAAKTMKCWV